MSNLRLVIVFLVACSNPVSLAHSHESGRKEIRIGFVTTLTTSAAVIGEDMQAGADLAMAHLDREMSGMPVDLIYKDDQLSPSIGKRVVRELLQRHDVDFVVGFIWSHVLLAVSEEVSRSGKFLISANAGPSQLAGSRCDENFFSASWQGDQVPMALAEMLNRQGVGSVYMMAPNYTAGRDMAAGFERIFKGKILGKDFTRWGQTPQLDFSVEMSKVRASGAEALWAFYPGGSNIAFVSQYERSGLSASIPLHSVFLLDMVTLPRFQEAGFKTILGAVFPHVWDPTLDIAENQRFVSAFRGKYGRYPSFYAAQSYDAINLIASAVSSVNGNMNDRESVRAALQSANFRSVRGRFAFGHNHFPIQNFYLRKVVEDSDGQWTTEIVDTIFENHVDPYASLCPRS